MAGEFGDLISLDFSNLSDAANVGAGNLDTGTAMPTAVPDTGGTNFSDVVKGISGGIKDTITPFASLAGAVAPIVGLGTAGMGLAAGVQGAKQAAQQTKIMREGQRLQGDASRATQAAAAPLTQFGSQELQAAQAGQIPPAIQAKIDLWKQGAMQKARDFAARSGQGDSTMLAQWEAYIEQQAAAMASDYLQEEQRMGIQSLQAGAGALSSAGGQGANIVQGAQQTGGSIENLMKQANEALAHLSAAA